jgi:hypothetical protein
MSTNLHTTSVVSYFHNRRRAGYAWSCSCGARGEARALWSDAVRDADEHKQDAARILATALRNRRKRS